jgi:hypothetical protein
MAGDPSAPPYLNSWCQFGLKNSIKKNQPGEVFHLSQGMVDVVIKNRPGVLTVQPTSSLPAPGEGEGEGEGLSITPLNSSRGHARSMCQHRFLHPKAQGGFMP